MVESFSVCLCVSPVVCANGCIVILDACEHAYLRVPYSCCQSESCVFASPCQ